MAGEASTAAEERQWVSPVEAAVILGISASTVYRGVADGSIPHWRRGRMGSIRIPKRWALDEAVATAGTAAKSPRGSD